MKLSLPVKILASLAIAARNVNGDDMASCMDPTVTPLPPFISFFGQELMPFYCSFPTQELRDSFELSVGEALSKGPAFLETCLPALFQYVLVVLQEGAAVTCDGDQVEVRPHVDFSNGINDIFQPWPMPLCVEPSCSVPDLQSFLLNFPFGATNETLSEDGYNAVDIYLPSTECLDAGNSYALCHCLALPLPPYVSLLDLGVNYCSLPTQELKDFFEFILGKAVSKGLTFVGTCLPDVLEGLQTQLGGGVITCSSDKTDFSPQTLVSSLEGDLYYLDWGQFFCLNSMCNLADLSTFLDDVIYKANAVLLGRSLEEEGYSIIETLTPTRQCYDGIVESLYDTEAYCAADGGSTCMNKALVEISLGTGVPFEVAVCDDDDCLAQITPGLIESLADAQGNNPFCLPEEETPQEITSVLVDYIETPFVSADYCSDASVVERFNAGECNSEEPEEPPVMSKSQKASKAKTGKSSKDSRRNRALRG